MRRISGRRPSPAMVIALVALVAAFAGESIAGVATKALSKKEKKQTRKLAKKQANKQINRRAPGLSVNHANTANSATSAGSATHANTANTANTATSADSASNANAVDGKSVATWLEGGVGGFNKLLFALGGFELRLSCGPGGAVIRANTTDASTGSYIEEDSGAAVTLPANGNEQPVESLPSTGEIARGFVIDNGLRVVAGSFRVHRVDTSSACRSSGFAIGG